MWSVLLLAGSLCPGQEQAPADQAQSPVAPAPAPPAPLAPPPADRWLLMRLLQGTYEGWLLDGNRIQVYGWDDLTYTASSDRRDNLPMGFNYRANRFLLQSNYLRVEMPVDQKATTPTFGFRSDTILPGADARFTIARGLFDSQLTQDSGQPGLQLYDPVQFYAEAYFPDVGRGLDVKFGRFFAQYGVESIDTTQNALESHSYSFIYDPFTHTGFLTTLKLTDAWSVQNGLVAGSDVFIAPEARLTYIGGVKWAPPDGADSVLFEAIAGPGYFETKRNFNNPEIFDLVYTHKFSARLNYSLDCLYGFETHVPGIGTGNWFGVVNYLTYSLTPRLSATTRLEFFDDPQGQRTGFPGLYTALTSGVTFKPVKDVWLRPELRYDYNDDSRPFEGKHALFTATMDVLLRW
jgi:hypothetical protein